MTYSSFCLKNGNKLTNEDEKDIDQEHMWPSASKGCRGG